MLFDVFQQSASSLLLGGVVVAVMALGFSKWKKNSRIYKLGGRAGHVSSYTLLFGISKP